MNMPKKISILGAGFIGKNLLNSYVHSGHSVFVLDHNSRPDNLAADVEWIQGSFESTADVERTIRGADVVFHLISSTVPADAIDENEEIFKNVVQTINLIKLCVQERVRRLVFASSASVYGTKTVLPINEKASTNPISSHGIHKLTIEKYLQLYKFNHGLDCKIIRLSNPYGQGQNAFGRQGFVAICVGKILKNDFIIVNGDGNAVRDFIHVDDVVSAFRLVAEARSDEMVFNIGTGRGVSINDVLSELQRFSRVPLKVTFGESRGNDIPKSVLDIRNAKEILGFEPHLKLREGLRRTVSSYVQIFPQYKSRFII